jgi:hypothetical protein
MRNTSSFTAKNLFAAVLLAVAMGAAAFLLPGSSISNGGGSGAAGTIAGLPGVSIPNAKFIGVAGAGHVAMGDVDLYTVPANKIGIIVAAQAYNDSGSGVAIFFEVKLSGTYYEITTAQTVNAHDTSGTVDINIVLPAGSKFSINVATGSVMNPSAEIWEADSTANISSAIVTSFASGDNTVYTAGAGQTASCLPAFVNVGPCNLYYFNGSGSARTIKWNLVPSGGSPSTSNLIQPAVSISNGTTGNTQSDYTLNAGDFISINTNSTAAGQIAWVNIVTPGIGGTGGALVTSVFGQTGAVNIPATTTDIATPAAPSAGTTKWYTKGGKLCSEDPAAVETCTGGGSSITTNGPTGTDGVNTWGPSFPLTLPGIVSSWTWINQGSATATDITGGGIGMVSPTNGGSNSLHLLAKALPMAPYTVTFMYLPGIEANDTYVHVGLSDGTNASTSKLVTAAVLSLNSISNYRVMKWNNSTSFNSDYVGTTGAGASFSAWACVRIQDDSTNRIISYAANCVNYFTVSTVGNTDFLTATNYLIGLDPASGATQATFIQVKVTTP